MYHFYAIRKDGTLIKELNSDKAQSFKHPELFQILYKRKKNGAYHVLRGNV